MKALVTGGAGFIGSHIAEALAKKGARVVILDNFLTGSRQNLEWKRPGAAVEFVEGDARDESVLQKVVPGCDWVFHEAALPSVPRSVEQPIESNSHNVDATLRLLVASRDAGVKRFVFASSSSIYGDAEAPLKREDLPPQPLSPYALQKYVSEAYCGMFHRLFGLPTVALRYFNVFGPRQAFDSPYSGVIAKFCTAFLLSEAPTIYGDGLQSRDFTYVDNVVEANLKAAEAAVESVTGRVFNIACGENITLLKLVDDLAELTGNRLKPGFAVARQGDIRHSCADISAARAAFGFTPRTEWKEGLRRTLDWYRHQER